MKASEIAKRDKFILKTLKQYSSKENCILAEDLTKLVKNAGFEITLYSLRARVQDLAFENWLPICHCPRGYYWATKREDIEACVRGVEATIQGLEKRLRHLKSFLPE
jgi:hypothetical protein